MKDPDIKLEQPINLVHSFELLNKILTEREIFKSTLEENAMAMSHHGLGRWIRNNWNLWWQPDDEVEESSSSEKPAIVKYFNETWGIDHADDMSGIILQSYHRHLNGKELGIEEQVEKYKAHWAKYGK